MKSKRDAIAEDQEQAKQFRPLIPETPVPSLTELLDEVERLHGEEWSVTHEAGLNVALRNAAGRAMLVGPRRHEPAFKDVAANHNFAPYVPALVKALRRAIAIIESEANYIGPVTLAYCEELAQLLTTGGKDE